MVRTAAHLVDNVLPRVPYRQWVLALPKRLRYFLHRDNAHAGAVLRIFLRAVETTLRNACPELACRELVEGVEGMAVEKTSEQEQGDGDVDPDTGEPEPAVRSSASRLCWAMLLARIYEVLPLLCPRCSCPLHVVAFITQPEVIVPILNHLGEPVEPRVFCPWPRPGRGSSDSSPPPAAGGRLFAETDTGTEIHNSDG
jgi:hypothetical protein